MFAQTDTNTTGGGSLGWAFSRTYRLTSKLSHTGDGWCGRLGDKKFIWYGFGKQT
jgi:hypothetical protein